MKHHILLCLYLLSASTASVGKNNSVDDDSMANILLRLKGVEERLDKVEGKIIELQTSKIQELPLNQTQMSSAEVLSWSRKSVEEIYSYRFDNYNKVLADIRHYFTADGYDSYLKALDESKNIQTVQQKKLIVNAMVTGTGKIVREGISKEIYTWDIELPVMVTYQHSVETIKQNLNISLEVIRVPFSRSPQGIAINSIRAEVATEMKKSDDSDLGTP